MNAMRRSPAGNIPVSARDIAGIHGRGEMYVHRMARILVAVAFAVAMQPAHASEPTVRAALMELRNLVYDAMYRNDAGSLDSAIKSLNGVGLRANPAERPYVDYYVSLAHWGLTASQVQAGDVAAGLASGRSAARHARAAIAVRPEDAEFHTLLANALIVVAILDRPNFESTAKELAAVRQRALALGPSNPRAVLMDAGMIFNNPPARGGSQERGIARFREALTCFEREAASAPSDPLAPRWGHAFAWGWLSNVLLAATPSQVGPARDAALAALQMRPDFWYVRDQVLPRLNKD